MYTYIHTMFMFMYKYLREHMNAYTYVYVKLQASDGLKEYFLMYHFVWVDQREK